MTWRRFGAVFACAVVASAVGYGRSPIDASTSPGKVAMRTLAKGNRYDAIAVIDGRIFLYGAASRSLAQSSTSSKCSSVVVNPLTLQLSDLRSGSCADPAVFGRSVTPAISVDKGLPARGGGPSDVVRIAHVTAGSPGYALGPIVMTFPYLAAGQTSPSWIYGSGDLWLYDWVNHFDLLRISATTGALLQRLVVPKIQSPLLAFNDEGLWIAPTGESSGPLYRLAPGATSVSAVFDLGAGGFAWWLAASGDSAWIEDQPRPVSEPATVWELRGPDAVPVWHQAPSPALKAAIEQRPYASPSLVVGNGRDGLWTVVVSSSGRQQQVIRIDPRTGKPAVAATLASPYPQELPSASTSILASWQATTSKGSLFILDPAAQVLGIGTEVDGFLYRVTPSGP